MDWLTNYFAPLQNGITIAQLVVLIIMAVLTVGSFSLKGWKRYALFVGGIVVILLSAHITIESARVQQANDKRAQQNDERLDEILYFVKRDNPELEGLDVDLIIATLKNVESRTTTLEKETQITVFIQGDMFEKQLADGTFETRFDLVPMGENIVPLFEIECQTINNAKIMDINIQSEDDPALPAGLWRGGGNPDRTIVHRRKEGSIQPGVLNISVLTDKKPDMHCKWTPALP